MNIGTNIRIFVHEYTNICIRIFTKLSTVTNEYKYKLSIRIRMRIPNTMNIMNTKDERLLFSEHLSATKKQRVNQLPFAAKFGGSSAKFGGIPEKNLYSSNIKNLVDCPPNLADVPPNLADHPKNKFYSTGPRSWQSFKMFVPNVNQYF